MSIDSEFSCENIKGYAKACLDLSDYIETYIREGYTNILMPSRGAYSLYRLAIAYLLDAENNLPEIGLIYLPYTADYAKGNGNHSEQIRKFWTNVLVSILKGKNDEYIKYYKFIVEEVSSQAWIHQDLCRNYKPIINSTECFIYIDTVISGRSAANIITNFKENQLDYKAILLVDKNGTQIKPEFKKIFTQMSYEHKLVMIELPRIFTEDTGPGLGGILGIVYPDLMELAAQNIGVFRNYEVVGSGIWLLRSDIARQFWYYPRISLEAIISFLLSINRHLESTKDRNDRDSIIEDWNQELQQPHTIELLKFFKQRVCEDKITSRDTTSAIFSSIKGQLLDTSRIKDYDVSSSHVLRVYFTQDYKKELVSKLKKL